MALFVFECYKSREFSIRQNLKGLAVTPTRGNYLMWPWICALAPCCLAVLAAGVPSGPPLSLAAPARPALAFHQYAVDLGPVRPTTEVKGYFTFVNRGTAPVTIDSLTPSCGCLQPVLESREYQPGEVGRLVVRTQPAGEKSGPREYFVDVRYHDPVERLARVTLRMVLPEERLSVRPRAVVFYQLGDDETEQTIHVEDTRGRPFQILDVSVDSSLANATIGERSVDPAGVVAQEVLVRVAGKVPAGRTRALVTITTDDPETKTLRVPLIIEGPTEERGTPSAPDHADKASRPATGG